MTVEEKFNQEIWWVLQEIKKEYLATPSDEYVNFELRQPNSDSAIPSMDDQRRVIRVLENRGAIKIHEKIFTNSRITNSPLLETFYGLKPKRFLLDILKQKFDEIYDEFAKIFEEETQQQKSSARIERDIVDTEKTKNQNRPYCSSEGGWGFLKFGKYGEKIKIGLPTSRHYRLLYYSLESLGVAKTIEGIFDLIKLLKDKNDPDLSGYDPYKRKIRQLTIIQNTIKELQKGNKLRGKLRFEFDDTKDKIWIKLL